ncbi:MAG: hypothetical protein GY866_26350 [Proteobacteria bacterium]|nr:hypothetical protein [Pseudomonadota bacterium]
MYFKIIKIDHSTVQTVYICEIHDGNLRFKHKKELVSHVYKSEIGTNYLEVDKNEIEKVGGMLKDRMLTDLVFFTEFYRRKLELMVGG